MKKIEVCKKCSNRKFDREKGIVCGLTNLKPAFEQTCPSFEQDQNISIEQKKHLKPNIHRAKAATMLILIIFALEFISLTSSYLQYNLLQNAANGIVITTEEATSNDTREQIIGIIYIIAYIISGVTFILWFRRAYYNLHQLVNHLSFSDGWAAGSWFVPVISLFRPYQIMKELFLETKKYVENRTDLSVVLSTSILVWWWILWIVNGVVGQIIFRVSTKVETIDQMLSLTVASMANGLIGIPLAIITLKIIKDYSKAELLLSNIEMNG